MSIYSKADAKSSFLTDPGTIIVPWGTPAEIAPDAHTDSTGTIVTVTRHECLRLFYGNSLSDRYYLNLISPIS